MTERTKNKTPHVLDARDERSVLISPENEDRFVLSCKETIQAVQSGLGEIAFQAELKELIKHISEWVTKRIESLHACYLASRDGDLVVFSVPKSDQYDNLLADELTELDVELAEKFQYWRCQVVQIPGKSSTELAAFLDEEQALAFHGPQDQATATQGEVAS
ncbi:MAG: hypothetical protein MI923_26910 [Phycisphaerales bacterium]|nr:hypothetical protein [Phycisphaerales bacterium]